MAVEAPPAVAEPVVAAQRPSRDRRLDDARSWVLGIWSALALPGIFAGSLLTFIPACGDFVNAALLGTPRQFMIGNVIQNKYLVIQDYPTAAALSFILMTFILIGIFLYARMLGARNLTEAAI